MGCTLSAWQFRGGQPVTEKTPCRAALSSHFPLFKTKSGDMRTYRLTVKTRIKGKPTNE